MINLLPPQDRLEIELSKRNSVLRRYIELSLVGVLIIALLVMGAHYYLKTQEKHMANTAELNKQKAQELSKTQEEAEQLAETINTIGALLARDVRFSNMLRDIGSLVPAGAVLTGLELSSADSKAPLLITAQIDNEQKGPVLRNNLANSKLFEKAEIKSITRIGDENTGGFNNTKKY